MFRVLGIYNFGNRLKLGLALRLLSKALFYYKHYGLKPLLGPLSYQNSYRQQVLSCNIVVNSVIEPLINISSVFFSFIHSLLSDITNIPNMLYRSLAESTQSTQSSRVSLVLCLENLYLVMFLSEIRPFFASCKEFCERLFCLLLHITFI